MRHGFCKRAGPDNSVHRKSPFKMKTLSIICGALMAASCSLAALYRYWLIMTFGVGFTAVGDQRLDVGAHVSLLAGGDRPAPVYLLRPIVGYPMLARRKIFPRISLTVSPAELRSA